MGKGVIISGGERGIYKIDIVYAASKLIEDVNDIDERKQEIKVDIKKKQKEIEKEVLLEKEKIEEQVPPEPGEQNDYLKKRSDEDPPEEEDPPEQPASIYGIVSGTKTGFGIDFQVVEGIIVTAFRYRSKIKTAITDSSGYYLISDIEKGDYCLKFEDPGFGDRETGTYMTDYSGDDAKWTLATAQEFPVGDNESVEYNSLVYEAEHPSEIFGIISGTDTGFQPFEVLGGIRIIAFKDKEKVSESKTDINGYYSIKNLSSGKYTLKFEDPGFWSRPAGTYMIHYYGDDANWTLRTAQEFYLYNESREMNFVLYEADEPKPPASIYGIVSGTKTGFDIDVPALVGIKVTLFSEGSGVYKNQGSDTTDYNGYFAFFDLEAGNYTFKFEDPGFGDRPPGTYMVHYYGDDAQWTLKTSQTFRLAGGETKEFGFLLYEANNVDGSIEGVVSAQNDDGFIEISGIVVTIFLNGDIESGAATTDANGVYRFYGIPQGEYKMRIEDPNSIYQMQYYKGEYDRSLDLYDGTEFTVMTNETIVINHIMLSI